MEQHKYAIRGAFPADVEVVVRDLDGTELFRGRNDSQGAFSFEVERPGEFVGPAGGRRVMIECRGADHQLVGAAPSLVTMASLRTGYVWAEPTEFPAPTSPSQALMTIAGFVFWGGAGEAPIGEDYEAEVIDLEDDDTNLATDGTELPSASGDPIEVEGRFDSGFLTFLAAIPIVDTPVIFGRVYERRIAIRIRNVGTGLVVGVAGPFCNPLASLAVVAAVGSAATTVPLDLPKITEWSVLPSLSVLETNFANAAVVQNVACRTGLALDQVEAAATVHRLVDEDVLPDVDGVAARSIYALARTVSPTDPASLSFLSREELEANLGRAVDAGIVDDAVLETTAVNDLVDLISSWKIDASVVDTAVSSAPQTEYGLLLTSGITLARARAYVSAVAAKDPSTSWANFWDAFEESAEAGPSGDAGRTRFTVTTTQFTGGFLPLQTHLQTLWGTTLTSHRSPAKWTAAEWESVLAEPTVGVPSWVPGADDGERRVNYAAAIAAIYEREDPTVAVVNRITTLSSTAVKTFVDDHPDFDFRFNRIDGLVDEVMEADLAAALRRTQRLFSIAPTNDRVAMVEALLDADIDSALDLFKLGPTGAMRLLSERSVSLSSIAETYKRASELVSELLMMRVVVNLDNHWGAIAQGMGDQACKQVEEGLKDLFGPPDYCECDPCKSVFSPAAYHVELLNWLEARVQDSSDPEVETVDYKDVLLQRRPDLESIALTCANAETVLPAIDLVNELLEHEVVRVAAGEAYVPPETWPQTTWRAEELAAHPEHLDQTAYEKLASVDLAEGARLHPWVLPFSLPLASARVYLKDLGVTRLALMETLQPFAPPLIPEAPAPSVERSIRNELLGLGWGVSELIVQPVVESGRTTNELWGLPAGAPALATLQRGDILLERTQLSFDELRDLLYCDPFSALVLGYEGEPCQLPNLRIVEGEYDEDLLSWSAGTAEVMQAFLRLHLATGWRFADLDAALRATGSALQGDTSSGGSAVIANEAVLNRLAHVTRLRRRFPRLSWGEILAWVGPLDRKAGRDGEASFYETVVVPRAHDEVLWYQLLNDFSGDPVIPEGTATLPAALNVAAADFERLKSYAPTAVVDATFAEFSTWWRIASVARATSLSLAELIDLLEIAEISAAGVLDGAVSVREDGRSALTDLLDLIAEIKRGPLSISELLFVTRGQHEARFNADNLGRTRVLAGITVALQATLAEVNAKAPADDLPSLESVDSVLQRWFTGDELEEARTICFGSDDPDDGRVDELFGALDSTPPSGVLDQLKSPIDARSSGWEGDLVTLILDALRTRELRNTAVQYLASALGVPPLEMSQMLDGFAEGAVSAGEVFTDPTFFDPRAVDAVDPYDPEVDAAALGTPEFAQSYLFALLAGVERPQSVLLRRLLKAAMLVRAFSLRDRDLRWIIGDRTLEQVGAEKVDRYKDVALDLEAVPVEPELTPPPLLVWRKRLSGYRWAQRATRIRSKLVGVGLWEVLEEFAIGGDDAAVHASIWPTLERAFDVEPNTFSEFFANVEGTDQVEAWEWGSLRELRSIEQLLEGAELVRRLGSTTTQALSWGRGAGAVASTADLEVSFEAAGEIRAAAQARYAPDAWLGKEKPIRDALRVTQRDALLAWVKAHYALPNGDEAFVSKYLIDPLVSPCVVTTRLRHALTAIQLFVQRGMLALDEELEFSELDAHEWEWMSRYRVWEANRKIFLYPENWLNPELRRDQTPEFRDFVTSLNASELDEDSAERAYTGFLDSVNKVANLRPCGHVHEYVAGSPSPARDVLHVFARSRTSPGGLYYRTRDGVGVWTPWLRVPSDCGTGDVLPVVRHGRVYVFWAHVEPGQPENDPKMGADTEKKIDAIGISWIELGRDGWGEPRTVSTKLNVYYRNADQRAMRDLRRMPQTLYAHGGETENCTVSLSHDLTDTSRIRIVARALYFSKQIASPSEFDEVSGAHPVSIVEAGSFLVFGETGSVIALPSPTAKAPPIQPNTWPSVSNFTAYRDFECAPPAFMEPYGQGYTWAGEQNPFDTTRRGFSVVVHGWRATSQDIILDPVWSGSIISLRRPRRIRAITMRTEGPLAIGAQANPWAEMFTVDVETASFLLTPRSTLAIQFNAPTIGGEFTANEGVAKGLRFKLEATYHPFLPVMMKAVYEYGVDGLLGTGPTEATDPEGFYLQTRTNDVMGPADDGYSATSRVLNPRPIESFDFSRRGAYSQYNWEMFLHAPLVIAERLMGEGKYKEAQKWLHYIFDPTRVNVVNHGGGRGGGGLTPPCREPWRVRPLVEAAGFESADRMWMILTASETDLNEDELAEREDLKAQMEAWRVAPFQPHEVARLRPQAYKLYVFMKYLDLLIAWADSLFAQDTLESINEAFPLYLFAQTLLGRRPVMLPPRDEVEVLPSDVVAEAPPSKFKLALNQLGLGLQTLPHENLPKAKVIANRAFVPPTPLPTKPAPTPMSITWLSMLGAGVEAEVAEPTFCAPPNEKFLGYWDTVDDRLYKIRNCLSLAGVFRTLSPFDPPLDPGAIAAALAAGLDLGAAISAASGPRPAYRFTASLGLAKELVAEVGRLSQALMSALERRDGEALSLLRQRQELDMLGRVREIRIIQIRDAESSLEAARKSKLNAEARQRYYASRQYMSGRELRAAGTAARANELTAASGTSSAIATGFGGIPGLEFGWSGGVHATSGLSISSILATPAAVASQVLSTSAQRRQFEASELLTRAGYDRRREDWKHQQELAEKDIVQIEEQIRGAEIRLDMAKRELSNHDHQTKQSREMLAEMQAKFSNEELYGWMAGELSRYCFAAYRIAYEVARRAEVAFQFETGDRTTRYVSFGHWDNRRKGQLAAESLGGELRRLEMAYVDANRREFEITKRISLSMLDPEQLMELRATGECMFKLPSWLFDMDFPTHYMRRIRLVSVTIPGVTGAFTSVPATLTYQTGQLRSTAAGELAKDLWAATESIAVSGGPEDAGLFDPNLRDERYLPFEGKGLDESEWRLTLPKTVRSFDYNSISDVVLTVRYTARDGGESVYALRSTQLKMDLGAEPRSLRQLVSLRSEFPEVWSDILSTLSQSPASDAVVTLTLPVDRLPYWALPKIADYDLRPAVVWALLRSDGATPAGDPIITVAFDPTTGPLFTAGGWVRYDEFERVLRASLSPTSPEPVPAPVPSTIELTVNSANSSLVDALQDIVIEFHYSVSEPEASP